MASKPTLRVSIFEKDLGFAHFMKEAAKLRKKPFVKVGATQARGSKVRPDGKLTNADLLCIHENGAPTRGIPARPALSLSVHKNQSKYDNAIEQLKDQIFTAGKNMTTEKALAIIGQMASADVKATIRSGIPPALAASTIRSKNASAIKKAKGTVRKLSAKGESSGYKAAQKASGSSGPINQGAYQSKLSDADKGRLNSAAEVVMSGGKSTPLIDTAQMINSIGYEVVMGGDSNGDGNGGGHK